MQDFRSAMHADFEHAQAEYGMSAARVAVKYGKSPTSSWPYQLMGGDVPFTIFMLNDWIELTAGEHLLRALCGNHHVVAPVQAQTQRGNAAATVRKFGDYLATTAQADADGKITKQEYAEIVAKSSLAMGAIVAEVHYYERCAKQSRVSRTSNLEQAS